MSFQGYLRQSTAVNVMIGPFVDSANGDDEETSLTINQADVRLSKNAGADAQKNDNTACAHEGDGMYMCELDATDTNTVGMLCLWVHVAGTLFVRHYWQVLEEAVYDAFFAGSAVGYVANQPVDVNTIKTNPVVNGGTITFPTGATLASTTNITAGTITTVTNLTNAPGAGDLTATMKTSVQTAAAAALTAYDPPTRTEATSDVNSVLTILGTPAADIAADIAAVKAQTAAIETDTAEIGAAGAGLTNINLPNQTMDITGNITGSLSGSVGSVTGLTASDVAAIKALLDDARGEPGQGAPAVNPDLATKIDYLYKWMRNKSDNDGSTTNFYNDAGDTVDQKRTTSESGGTVTNAEIISGA